MAVTGEQAATVIIDDVKDQPQRKLPLFRSCFNECAKPVTTEITGEIPTWLKGTLIRNGPGLRRVGDTEYKHLFDGLALLHQFQIDGERGTVTYRNRFLRSDAYVKNMQAQRIVVSDFGTRAYPDPCKSILQRFMAYFTFRQFTDNDSVNVYPIGDQIYATTETPYIRRIDPQTLETFERHDTSKYLAVATQTAHPHIGEDGSVYNLASNFGSKGTYSVICIPADANSINPLSDAKLTCSIPMKRPFFPSYYHSFCMTENYIIFIEQPLVISVPSMLLKHFSGGSLSSALKWKPKYKTRFHLVNRNSGKLVSDKYVSDPFSFFHSINAYEDADHVVIDLCCYRDGNIVRDLYAKSLTDAAGKKSKENSDHSGHSLRSEARRYVLPVVENRTDIPVSENLNSLAYSRASAIMRNDKTIFCAHEQLTKGGYNTAELPRINYEKCNGKKYRYFYAITRRETDFLTQLVKVDTETKETKIWCEDNHYPSEPIFIERPDATEEDDGVVVSAVVSENDEKSGFLIILDGRNFNELGRASFKTQSAIPTDFHGMFLRP